MTKPVNTLFSRFKAVSLIVSCWMALHVLAADTISLRGGKLDWTGDLASGWVGGTAEQIERVMTRSDNAALTAIMQEMLLDAQVLDIYFTHLDVTGIGTRTLSTLRSNVMERSFQLDNDSDRAAMWSAFADLQQSEAPETATVSLAGSSTLAVGGQVGYEAVFRTDYPDGGTVYEAVVLVNLNSNLSQIFKLRADGNKFTARYEEFRNMLATVKYNL